MLTNRGHQEALQAIETAADAAQAPLQRMEHALHPLISHFIVPLFALANAGVPVGGDLGATLSEPLVLAVLVGLVGGKQIGILLAAWLIVRTGWASLPSGVTWRHIYGAAWLGGIGFTMSLFVADLAFGATPALALAKIGILAASVIAGLGGYLILRGSSARAEA